MNRTGNKFNVVSYLKGVLTAFCLLILITGPIMGMVIKNYTLNNDIVRPITVAVILTILYAISSLLWNIPGDKNLFRAFFKQKNLPVKVANPEPGKLLLYFVVPLIGFALIVPFMIDKYYLSVLILAYIYVLLGLGLNIVIGLAGLLDLGYVAFYAVGAYALALLSKYFGLGFWSVLPLAAFIAAFFGMMLGFPVLRTHGDYLAIVTLGFGEIIRLVLTNWLELTNGPNGLPAPIITFFGYVFDRGKGNNDTFHELVGIEFNFSHEYIFLNLILFMFVCAAIYFTVRLKKMPIGRAWEALREDEIACRSLGLNHVNVKLGAFMMGAMFGGIGGVFFGASQHFVNPTSFTFIESALIVAIVVLGGLGSTMGVVISAMVLTIVPELFRDFNNYRVLAFGAVMVIMMLWRPRGLIQIARPFIKRASEAKGGIK